MSKRSTKCATFVEVPKKKTKTGKERKPTRRAYGDHVPRFSIYGKQYLSLYDIRNFLKEKQVNKSENLNYEFRKKKQNLERSCPEAVVVLQRIDISIPEEDLLHINPNKSCAFLDIDYVQRNPNSTDESPVLFAYLLEKYNMIIESRVINVSFELSKKDSEDAKKTPLKTKPVPPCKENAPKLNKTPSPKKTKVEDPKKKKQETKKHQGISNKPKKISVNIPSQVPTLPSIPFVYNFQLMQMNTQQQQPQMQQNQLDSIDLDMPSDLNFSANSLSVDPKNLFQKNDNEFPFTSCAMETTPLFNDELFGNALRFQDPLGFDFWQN